MASLALRLATLMESDPEQAESMARAIRANAARAAKVKAVRSAPRKAKAKADSLNAIARQVEVRREVIARDGGVCQGCRSRAGTEMDHFWGRGREESAESCWMLCAQCHRLKTDNIPSRLGWIQQFQAYCIGHKFKEQTMKCDRAIALERAQHPVRTAP